jgi:O-antigen/teichoic acid export membrane protein
MQQITVKNIFSRVLKLGGVHAITLTLGLGSVVLWTRFFPQAVYGEYKVVISILSFIGVFCFVGVTEGALKSAARGFDGNYALLLRSKVLSNAFGSLAILLVALYYLFFRDDARSLGISLVIASIIFPIYNLGDIWAAWLNGKSRFWQLSIGKIIGAALPPLFVCLAIAFEIESLWIIVLMSLSAIGLLNLTMVSKATPSEKNLTTNESTLNFARHATAALTFSAFLALDLGLLEHFHGAAEVAIYAVALVLPEQFKAGVGLLNQAVAPNVYSSESLKKLLVSLRSMIVKLFLVTSFIAYAGYLVFPAAVDFLFTEQYAQSGEIGKWLWVVAAMTAPINTFLGAIVVSRHHIGRMYFGSFGYSFIFLSLCFFYIDLGAQGFIYARIGTMISTSIFHFCTLCWLVQKEKDSIRDAQ